MVLKTQDRGGPIHEAMVALSEVGSRSWVQKLGPYGILGKYLPYRMVRRYEAGLRC